VKPLFVVVAVVVVVAMLFDDSLDCRQIMCAKREEGSLGCSSFCLIAMMKLDEMKRNHTCEYFE
jgi:hypothetical protein